MGYVTQASKVIITADLYLALDDYVLQAHYQTSLNPAHHGLGLALELVAVHQVLAVILASPIVAMVLRKPMMANNATDE